VEPEPKEIFSEPKEIFSEPKEIFSAPQHCSELWLMRNCVQVWCSEAYDRVQTNLGMLKSPTALDNFKTMAKISEVNAVLSRSQMLICILINNNFAPDLL
jgi:hypothetical protein